MGLFDFFKNLLKGNAKKRSKAIKQKRYIPKDRSKKKPPKKTFKKSKPASGKKKRKNSPPKQPKTGKKKISSSKSRRIISGKKNVVKPGASAQRQAGTVTHFFDKISVGVVKLSSPLAVGSTIHIKGSKTDFTQAVASMQRDHKEITYAERGLEIAMKVAQPVREGDKVYLV